MTLFTHLSPADDIRSIRRAGIRARSRDHEGRAGVFCLPVMPSYQITHQWGRELHRRGGRRTMVAVDFRLPDDEPVLVGRYNHRHIERTSAEAAALIAGCEDARGYEVFVPRAIGAREIHRVRGVNRVTGWRYMPNAHGRFPCPCCLARGEYGSAKIRKKAESRGY
ncbi:hypothetical protein [Streptosporangium saharense]|uniref:Uncharacterized protein n=1 Tax=Streptosporangium saharense TaxID=1706840 RepID=A0A7W7VR13_9ACTN|nr:hypothetical protein [Streptosporangium saharense]MBB4919109.1 hypothetical protein [Streptosporangium saharense]